MADDRPEFVYQEKRSKVDDRPEFVYQEKLSKIAPFVVRGVGVEPNQLLLRSRPYLATFDEIGGDSVVALLAGGNDKRKVSNDKSGMIDIRTIVGTSTGDFSLYLFDNQNQRYLSNRPIHSQLIMGNGLRPFSLPIPLYLCETQSLICDMVDLSAAPNTVRLAFSGVRYYMESKDLFDMLSPATKISRPFVYTTDSDVTIAALPATQEATAYITLQGDGDFYAYRFLTQSTGSYLVRIQDVSTGIEFSNGWIHSSMIGGDSQYSWDFEPQMFQRRGQLKLRFQSLSGLLNRIYFGIAGYNAHYRR